MDEDGYGRSFILGSIYWGGREGRGIILIVSNLSKRVFFFFLVYIWGVIELRSIEYLCAWTIIILNEKLQGGKEYR